MEAEAKGRADRRVPVTRDRIMAAAIGLADEGGTEALTMRRIGHSLGVEAMALYRHVANKNDIIDGIVDLVWAEIGPTQIESNWKEAMHQRAISLRDGLLRHRWAIGLMESRTNPGPANLEHHDAVIGCLRASGFEMASAAHAYSLLDSYIYGFALTKMSLPFESTADITEMAQSMLQPFPLNAYPNLADFITEHAMQPGYEYADEFEYGLDLILDGLEVVHKPV